VHGFTQTPVVATVVTEMQALRILTGMKASHLASDRAVFEDGPVCIFHTALRKRRFSRWLIV
jgi:hypothetical protein